MVVGSSGSGKPSGSGNLVSHLLKQHYQIFKPKFQQFLYFYNHFQPINQELQKLPGPNVFFPSLSRCWFVPTGQDISVKPTHSHHFWRCLSRGSWRERVLNVVISGRYQKLHQYQQSTNSETIYLNITQLLSPRDPRDTNQIDYRGRQFGCRESLLNSYKRARQDKFGHLRNDLDHWLNKNFCFSSNIIYKPAIFF